MASMEQQLGQLQGQVAAIQTDVSGLKSDLRAMSGEFAELRQIVTQAATDKHPRIVPKTALGLVVSHPGFLPAVCMTITGIMLIAVLAAFTGRDARSFVPYPPPSHPAAP